MMKQSPALQISGFPSATWEPVEITAQIAGILFFAPGG
jgi:hypothetical protein